MCILVTLGGCLVYVTCTSVIVYKYKYVYVYRSGCFVYDCCTSVVVVIYTYSSFQVCTVLASFPGRVDSKNNTVDRQLGLVLIVFGRVSGRG